MFDRANHAYLDQQGHRFGISQHTVDVAKAVYLSVDSGEVALPFSQMETENALMHDYLLPCLDLMIQYPAFIPIAIAYATSRGLVISDDREVSIFEVV